ncbi:PREDICTED: ES1 protein homolog, mitochondrial [Condylura cristata]|uniref:ES1 protein homolog, mitochondrial n=1 Tax=Condylura cristata TaxID=143302 RepID=UPI0006437100|nr:PREDICTED: ES1 protein homolog, mitochondrial [Condylura cristata]
MGAARPPAHAAARPPAHRVLVHLSRAGADVQIFAPNMPQMHVVDHVRGQPADKETRNVLTESARIARGKITDLAELRAANHDAAIFPGGFGAAKNLSTFAVDGKDCEVHGDVERVLKEFHGAGKPIGYGAVRGAREHPAALGGAAQPQPCRGRPGSTPYAGPWPPAGAKAPAPGQLPGSGVRPGADRTGQLCCAASARLLPRPPAS